MHGEWLTYLKGGCRCDECKSAWASYRREKRASYVYDVSDLHGSMYTYNKGCRCRICKDKYNQVAKMGENRRLQKHIGFKNYEYHFNEQNGLCKLCGLPPVNNKPLVVDHDHISGVYRGLLHYGCNSGLGMFKDNIGFLQKAINYLA